MYLFPTITLPEGAVEAAKKEHRAADEFYALRLLDATGVCVVPGSGFGQKEGTLHFRTTFLAPGTEWTKRIIGFHQKFMEEFKTPKKPETKVTAHLISEKAAALHIENITSNGLDCDEATAEAN